MKLHRLTLRNFRQFQQGQITFAGDSKNNVTVIHGQNGSGKTTLLNAFTWVLYGEVDFDQGTSHLANEGVLAEAEPGDTVRVEVELEFEDEETEYEARRWADYRKKDPHDLDGEVVDEGLELMYQDESGAKSTRENPEVAIDQIVPPRLSNLFFFDGEDIDDLAGIDNQDQIKEAIQNIMGLTILERSISHLDTVAGRFEDTMKEYGSSELSELVDKKREVRAEIENREEKIEDIQSERDELHQDIQEIEKKLSYLDDSSSLQQERKRKEDKRDELEERVRDLESDLRSEITSRGYLAFVMPAIEETAKDLDELREQGKIPSELGNRFVDELLSEGNCICGRPLEEHTEAYEAVVAYKSDADFDGVDQAAIRIISHIGHISDERSALFEELESIVQKRKELSDDIASLNEQIDGITAELEDIDISDGHEQETPAELEATRQQKAKRREELLVERTELEKEIENYQTQLDELKKEIEAAREEEERAQLARTRMVAAETTRDTLREHFTDLQHQVRELSDDMVKQTFEEIASKGYRAEITDEFKLRITQKVGDNWVEVVKSTGERQIASLAFIGSLVSIAKRRYESDSESDYFTGGIYPIVMDSPFGALDIDHRRMVSEVIPGLAEQVVIMVTDSQWEGPVEQKMGSVMGAEYTLDFNEGTGRNEYPKSEIVPNEVVVEGGL